MRSPGPRVNGPRHVERDRLAVQLLDAVERDVERRRRAGRTRSRRRRRRSARAASPASRSSSPRRLCGELPPQAAISAVTAITSAVTPRRRSPPDGCAGAASASDFRLAWAPCGSSPAAGCVAALALPCAAAGVAADSRPVPGHRAGYTPLTLVLDHGRVEPLAAPAAAAAPAAPSPPLAGAAAKAGLTFPQALLALAGGGELTAPEANADRATWIAARDRLQAADRDPPRRARSGPRRT